jgi:CBS domain-containing protein
MATRVVKKKAKITKRATKKVTKKATASPLDPRRAPVKAVMSKKVKAVRPDTSLETVVGMMMNSDISHLPVTNDAGKLVGIISKTDVVRRYFMDGDDTIEEVRLTGKNGIKYWAGPGFHQALGQTVSEFMSKQVRTVDVDATIAEAADAMVTHKVHGLPVVSDKQALVGFVSSLDITRWVAR